MMEVIRALQVEGYELAVDGNNIRYHYRLHDRDAPDKEKVSRLLSELKARKAEAISFLKAYRRGQDENVDPRPDMRTITVFSKVLNREVFISWEGDNPERVLFDGIPYTLDEITKLKEMPLTPDDLRMIHRAKGVFAGQLQL